jgi:hypothetical protein
VCRTFSGLVGSLGRHFVGVVGVVAKSLAGEQKDDFSLLQIRQNPVGALVRTCHVLRIGLVQSSCGRTLGNQQVIIIIKISFFLFEETPEITVMQQRGT